MSAEFDHGTIGGLIEALADYRVASEQSGNDQSSAALIAVGLVMMIFPGATLLKEIVETSIPRAAAPKQDDEAALLKIAELVANGSGLSLASRAAVPLAASGANDDATAQRLRRKFRADRDWYMHCGSATDEQRDTIATINGVRRLLHDFLERKIEYEDRPYAKLIRDLKKAQQNLEERINDSKRRSGT